MLSKATEWPTSMSSAHSCTTHPTSHSVGFIVLGWILHKKFHGDQFHKTRPMGLSCYCNEVMHLSMFGPLSPYILGIWLKRVPLSLVPRPLSVACSTFQHRENLGMRLSAPVVGSLITSEEESQVISHSPPPTFLRVFAYRVSLTKRVIDILMLTMA